MSAQKNMADRLRSDPSWVDSGDASPHGFVVRQRNRVAVQALQLPLARDWTVAQLRDGKQRLAQTAAKQQLRVLEPPLATLLANPVVDPPETWSWQLLQPVSGRVQVDDLDEDISTGRTHGGTFVQATTTEGLAGLDRLYGHLFREYLPRYKHRLTRPCIYHRATDGLERDDPNGLLLVVFVPVMLSLVRGELGPSISSAASEQTLP